MTNLEYLKTTNEDNFASELYSVIRHEPHA